jgi:hypothetical protein
LLTQVCVTSKNNVKIDPDVVLVAENVEVALLQTQKEVNLKTAETWKYPIPFASTNAAATIITSPRIPGPQCTLSVLTPSVEFQRKVEGKFATLKACAGQAQCKWFHEEEVLKLPILQGESREPDICNKNTESRDFSAKCARSL